MMRLTFMPDGATPWPPSASQAYHPAAEPDWSAKGVTLRRLEAGFSAVTLASLLALAAAVASLLK
jgi:hypothetical protein